MSSTLPLVPPIDLATVRGLLGLLRQHGVTKFEGLSVSIELSTDSAATGRGTTAARGDTGDHGHSPEIADTTCRCGHHLQTEHNEHGCLHGCALDVCAPSSEGDAE